MYANPAMEAPPNKAGSLANFSSRFGRALAKEAFRTATIFENGVWPAGHIRLRAALTAESDRNSPPAEEVVS